MGASASYSNCLGLGRHREDPIKLAWLVPVPEAQKSATNDEARVDCTIEPECEPASVSITVDSPDATAPGTHANKVAHGGPSVTADSPDAKAPGIQQNKANIYSIGEIVEVRDSNAVDWKQRGVTRIDPLLVGGVEWNYVRKIEKATLAAPAEQLPAATEQLSLPAPVDKQPEEAVVEVANELPATENKAKEASLKKGDGGFFDFDALDEAESPKRRNTSDQLEAFAKANAREEQRLKDGVADPVNSSTSNTRISNGTPSKANSSDAFSSTPGAKANASDKKNARGKAEKRVDPYDGCAYTFAELSAFYAKFYLESEIQWYWKNTCWPVKTSRA